MYLSISIAFILFYTEGKQLAYECKASKKLRMTRVILKKKESNKDSLSGKGRTDTA